MLVLERPLCTALPVFPSCHLLRFFCRKQILRRPPGSRGLASTEKPWYLHRLMHHWRHIECADVAIKPRMDSVSATAHCYAGSQELRLSTACVRPIHPALSWAARPLPAMWSYRRAKRMERWSLVEVNRPPRSHHTIKGSAKNPKFSVQQSPIPRHLFKKFPLPLSDRRPSAWDHSSCTVYRVRFVPMQQTDNL